MSVEALLLVALFVLLPIVEQLIKRARRQRDEAEQAAAAARPRAVPAIPVEPPLEAMPSPPAAVEERPRPPVRPPRRSRPVRIAPGDSLRSVGGLRQAMVTRIILGPCRALEDDGDAGKW